MSAGPDPRVSAFVSAQKPNLPFYKAQGLALFSSYLSSNLAARNPPPVDHQHQSSGEDIPFHLPSSPPATPADVHRGASGVDVLNAARQEKAADSGVKATGAESGAGARKRLVDRMKGRDGIAQPSTSRATKGKKRESSGGSSTVVLTKKQLREVQPVSKVRLGPGVYTSKHYLSTLPFCYRSSLPCQHLLRPRIVRNDLENQISRRKTR